MSLMKHRFKIQEVNCMRGVIFLWIPCILFLKHKAIKDRFHISLAVFKSKETG